MCPKKKKRDFFSQWAAKILRWQPYNGNPGQQADQDGYCFNNAAAATIHKRFWCLHAVCHFPENNELAFEKNTLFWLFFPFSRAKRMLLLRSDWLNNECCWLLTHTEWRQQQPFFPSLDDVYDALLRFFSLPLYLLVSHGGGVPCLGIWMVF